MRWAQQVTSFLATTGDIFNNDVFKHNINFILP